MKTKRKVIAFLCMAAVICSMLPSGKAIAAQKKTINYVALGDSIGAGYGLDGYVGGLKADPPKDSYQSLIADRLQADGVNDAVSGMTSQDLIDLLNSGKTDEELSTADCVTISIGSNDILGLFIKIVSNVAEPKEGEDLLSAVYRQVKEKDILTLIYELGNLSEEIKDNPEIHEAAKAFTHQFKNIMSLVKAKAPNAKVYVTNIYNPYIAVDNEYLPLGTCAESYIKEMNEAFDSKSADYTLIDAHKLFEDGSQVNVSFDLQNPTKMNLDPHPNKEGHHLLAEAFLKEIQSNGLAKAKITSAVSKKINQITVEIEAQEAADGYLITYSTSKNGTYKKLKSSKKASVSITSEKLKSGKTYYIKVAAYTLDNETKGYGKTSTAKKVTIQ